jgi:hypothetical protein
VVPEQQVIGQVADGWRLIALAALDCQQQLMLRRGQACLSCLFLAPVQEPAQAGAEGGQARVVHLHGLWLFRCRR